MAQPESCPLLVCQKALVYEELPSPERQFGHVTIQVKGFGLNHAGMHMRKMEWDESHRHHGWAGPEHPW